MRIRKLVLNGVSTVALLALTSASAAFAQSAPSNEELGKRVDGIETKLDALIELMTKQDSKAASTIDNQTPVNDDIASDDGEGKQYKNGLTLDLHLVQPPSDGQKIADAPVGSVAASESIPVSDSFEWGVFVDIHSMAQFSAPIEKKRVGIDWSGFLQIPESGENIFVLDINESTGSMTSRCISVLRLDEVEVVRAVSEERKIQSWSEGYSEPRFATEEGSVTLEKGLHRFSLWGHCLGQKREFSKVRFNLKVKGPNDRAPKRIDPSRFVTEG